MSALEQEPLILTGITVGVGGSSYPISLPGSCVDRSLAAVLQRNVTPFTGVHIRGLVVVTGTASIITASLRQQGGGTVPPNLVQAGAAAVGVPLPLEWWDSNPNSVTNVTGPYNLVLTGSIATVATLIINITGYDG